MNIKLYTSLLLSSVSFVSFSAPSELDAVFAARRNKVLQEAPAVCDQTSQVKPVPAPRPRAQKVAIVSQDVLEQLKIKISTPTQPVLAMPVETPVAKPKPAVRPKPPVAGGRDDASATTKPLKQTLNVRTLDGNLFSHPLFSKRKDVIDSQLKEEASFQEDMPSGMEVFVKELTAQSLRELPAGSTQKEKSKFFISKLITSGVYDAEDPDAAETIFDKIAESLGSSLQNKVSEYVLQSFGLKFLLSESTEKQMQILTKGFLEEMSKKPSFISEIQSDIFRDTGFMPTNFFVGSMVKMFSNSLGESTPIKN